MVVDEEEEHPGEDTRPRHSYWHVGIHSLKRDGVLKTKSKETANKNKNDTVNKRIKKREDVKVIRIILPQSKV